MSDQVTPDPSVPIPVSEQEPVPKPTVFILGPSLAGVIEPLPVPVVAPALSAVIGRRQVSFQSPPTTPGGNVHLQVLPPLQPSDVLPVNVYAFFVPATTVIPDASALTPDFFFKSGAPSGSVHIGVADPATGAFTIPVPGVEPSLTPYFVQSILEFPVS